MGNARSFKHIAVGIVILLPLLYLWIVWSDMADRVPMHYNMRGEIDRYGDKAEMLTAILTLTGVNLGTYLLMVNIHKIDPKRAQAGHKGSMEKLALGVSLFLTALTSVIIIDAKTGGGSIGEKAIIPLVGLLLAFIGNYMHNLKPNYFAGIRTPWALNDEDNWKQTHQLASHIWFGGGLTIFILAFMCKAEVTAIVMMGIVAIMVIVPYLYSFILFKKTKNKNQ